MVENINNGANRSKEKVCDKIKNIYYYSFDAEYGICFL